MVDEKPKSKNDEKTVEWSFDFASVGESVKELFSSLAGDVELQETELSVLKKGVKTANVTIDFSMGKGSLTALEGAKNLLEASLVHVGEIELTDEGTADKSIRLKQKNKRAFGAAPFQAGLRALTSKSDLRWDIGLAAKIPLTLTIDGGVGPTKVDLSSLNVVALEIDAGVGTLKVTLPPQALDADIDGGVGQTHIVIPDGFSGALTIDGGVGALEITLPPNAMVQINAQAGLGAINVPKSLTRLTKQEFMTQGGVWQSDGFELAEEKIIIQYDGGVGQFTVREVEVV